MLDEPSNLPPPLIWTFPAPSIVNAVIGIHLIQLVALLTNPGAINTTTLHGMSLIFNGTSGTLAALLFAIVTACAATLLGRHGRGLGWLLLLLPQQILLTISCGAAVAATVLSHYGDGVIRSWEFIMADQGIYCAISVAHFIGLLRSVRRI